MGGNFGTSIRILLVDGIPDGLRFVEKSNLSGQALDSGQGYVRVGSRARYIATDRCRGVHACCKILWPVE